MNRNKRWLSLKRLANGNSVQSLPSQYQPQTLVIYRSIVELPLSRFIDCIVDNNLYALVKKGTVVNPIELRDIWFNILNEYSECISTNEYKLYVRLRKEVDELELNYNSLTRVLSLLQPGIYSKVLCDELNKTLGCKLEFDYTNDNKYKKDLRSCKSRSAALRMQLDFKKIHLETIKKKQVDGQPLDRLYYDSILVTLEDHSHLTLDPEKITVSKFCERLKRFNAYVHQLQTKKK